MQSMSTLHNSRRSQPPLARSVPLSRFTSRVGGGSAFYVDHPHRSHEGVTSLGIGYGTFILDHTPVRGFLDAEVQHHSAQPRRAAANRHAKRLECDQHAGAVVRRGWLESGNKLHALQTLRAGRLRTGMSALRNQCGCPEGTHDNSCGEGGQSQVSESRWDG